MEYVVITTPTLAGEYQPLADWKTAKGVPTVVRTVDWIVANTRNGTDLAETIRFFIRDAYDYWGTKYVLLGGDVDILPARLLDVESLPTQGVASDMYFACLDGSWNEDHDNEWGEVPDDAPDLIPEVFVGRVPLSTLPEVRAVVDKVIAYEFMAGRTDRVLLMAEVLFPPDWSEGGQAIIDGADLMEPVYTSTLNGPALDVVRMYEANTLHAGSVKLSRAAAIDSLNSGFIHAFALSRGGATEMSAGDVSLDLQDASALVNLDTPSTVYVAFGVAGAFQQDCLAEAFLANPGGGAVAVIAPSDPVYLQFPMPYLAEYTDLVFTRGVVHIGQAFTRSKLPRVPLAEQGGGDLQYQYAMNLFGDPELPLFTAPAGILDVTHPAAVVQGASTITVHVESAGLPVDSAVVCVSKPDDVYMVLETDATGEAMADVSPATTGALRVVVTALNHRPSDSTIDVQPSNNAVVSIADIAVDDVAGGNANGVVDAGETVILTPRLRNTGGGASGTISFTLRTNYAGTIVVDSTGGGGPLGTGQSLWAGDAVGIALGTLADQSRVPLHFEIHDGGGGQWDRREELLVHAPRLERIALRVDDTPPLGDGDGVVSDGETFRLYYELKNYGSGAASSLVATVTDVDGHYQVMEGADTYAVIDKLGGGENKSGFLLRRMQSAGAARIAVTIIGPSIATYTDTIDMTPPEPPGAPSFGPGPTSVAVRWAPSPSGDVNRYQVFRSDQTGGPYTLATVDPVWHPEFTDEGLTPNTHYFYSVRAIDVFGNASVLSEEGRVTTVADQAPGFPARTLFPSNCSPAMGDIDGDGDLEVVTAARALYAWHHDGTEVADGDSNPYTTGILSAALDANGSAVTLAALDGVAGLDIVVTDSGNDRVHCLDHTGAPLGGWPRQAGGRLRSAPVIADLDGDGSWEVIVVDLTGVVYAWRSNGTEYRDGDTDATTDGVFFVSPGKRPHFESVAVCDIDDDRDDEIVFSDSSAVYVVDGAASMTGWPVDLEGEVVGAPVSGDVDGDEALEILVRTRDDRMILLEKDGVIAAGWPRTLAIDNPFIVPTPALADFDGDGTLEIAALTSSGSAVQLHLMNYHGSSRSGWPVMVPGNGPAESAPVIADINGDGSLDVVLCDAQGRINAWDAGGTILDGFPIMVSIQSIQSTPFIGDVDGDGDVDLLVSGSDARTYVFDLPAAFDRTRAPWPTFQANLARNGNADYEALAALSAADFTFRADDAGVLLAWRMPAAARFRYDVRRAILERWGTTDFVGIATDLVAAEEDLVSLRDDGAQPGSRYIYELQVVSNRRARIVTEPFYIPVTRLELLQNVPNPFNPTTAITYFVPEGPPQRVTLTIHDVRGARVKTLLNWPATAPGRYVAVWDGTTDAGGRAASGVYFYRLQREGVTATKKMVLVR